MALPSQGFLQQAHVGGVGGGAGALRVGMAGNQTGNLLGLVNADLAILTPEKMVGHMNHPNGTKKKRFGPTTLGGGHVYDYIDLSVKNPTGNGQSYKATRGGTEGFGNVQGSAAGWDHHDARWKPEENLSEAMDVACRAAHMIATQAHDVKPSHSAYLDRTRQAIEDRMAAVAEDHQRDRMRDLLEKGFSEAEIEAKMARERERNIERAKNLPASEAKLLEGLVAAKMPHRINEDFANTSVPPGNIPLTKDLSAIQRVTGQGNPRARARATEQLRVRDQMARRVDKVESHALKEAHIPVDHFTMLKGILHSEAAAKRDTAYHRVAHEAEHISHQVTTDRREHEHLNAMRQALGQTHRTHVEAEHGNQPYVPGLVY